MQQRQPRLGDILDDYCPRERRLTNHAVVAMIGDQVKQTRCTTCDAEHDYKHGKVPRPRKKQESATGLYKEVLAGLPKKPPAPGAGQIVTAQADAEAPAAQAAVPNQPVTPPLPETPAPVDEDGPVHRPLIRATLPRPEGQTPQRPVPEFTMRQPTGRSGRFRPGGNSRNGHRSNRPHGFASQPPGAGGARQSGSRHGPPGQHTDRFGPMSNRGGNRPPYQHRAARPTAGPLGRPGKKRSR